MASHTHLILILILTTTAVEKLGVFVLRGGSLEVGEQGMRV